jgi:hypothetical protein
MSGGPAVPRSSSGPWPIMGSAPPFVGRPVHEPWPGGKLPERVVRAVAQPHADSPGASRPPLMGRFQLARVAQPVAVATGEHAPDDVQPDDPASTATALEPRPLADCKASRQWRCAAHGPRISPLRRRAGRRARAAEGSHPGASPARRCACSLQQATCRRPKGAPSAAPIIEIAWLVLVLRGTSPYPPRTPGGPAGDLPGTPFPHPEWAEYRSFSDESPFTVHTTAAKQ